MAHDYAVEPLLDRFANATPDAARALTRALPPSRHTSCYGLLADGTRHVFPTTQALLRWSHRTQGVVAICLDTCVWRSFASFRRNLNTGMAVDQAFDTAELHNWDLQTASRKRLGEVRAA